MPRPKVPCIGCGTPREVRSKDAKPLCQSCRRKRQVTTKTAPTARHLATVTEMTPPADETLLAVVDAAAEHMAWLKPTDKAMVEVARRLARVVDDAVVNAEQLAIVADLAEECVAEIPGRSLKLLYARLEQLAAAIDVSKAVIRVAPHLTAALRDLGGAPAERKGLEPDGPVENKLARIRATAEANRRTSRSR